MIDILWNNWYNNYITKRKRGGQNDNLYTDKIKRRFVHYVSAFRWMYKSLLILSEATFYIHRKEVILWVNYNSSNCTQTIRKFNTYVFHPDKKRNQGKKSLFEAWGYDILDSKCCKRNLEIRQWISIFEANIHLSCEAFDYDLKQFHRHLFRYPFTNEKLENPIPSQ